MSELKAHAVRTVAGPLCCLLLACSSEDPAGSAATGGVTSTGGVATGTGGAPTAGSGGTTGGVVSSGGTLAAGSGGTTGGVVSSGGTPGAGSGGATGGVGASGGTPAGGGGAVAGGAGGTAGAAFTLTSPAFASKPGCEVQAPAACDVFPDENVSYMERPNQSPELHWAGVPPGTQSFAIVLMDATYGQAHWVLWNIPADVRMLAANVPKDTSMPPNPPGSRQSNANFANREADGYFGPHVPCNVFEFQIYALSSATFSPMDPDSAVLVSIELQSLKDSAPGFATLIGRSGDYGMTCVAP